MLKSELTNAEQLIMKCIWDTPKDMVLSELVAMVNERYGKDWKPQTVSTYLAHLVQKEFLKMTRNGKIYTYHPLVAVTDYRAKELDKFKTFWDVSSLADFLAAYVSMNEISKEEMEALKKLVG